MKRIGLILLSLLISTGSFSQIVVDRTNSIWLDLSKDLNTSLPAITWKSPQMEYTNSEENTIQIIATVSSVRDLKSVQLGVKQSLDGDPIAVKVIDLDSESSALLNQELYLMDGQNYVEIIAENIDGGIVKDTRSVIVGMDALKDAIAIDRKDIALLFATDKYDNWNDLVNPIFDSNTIAKELEDRYGFDVEIVQNATQDEVFIKLREYAQKNYKPQDQLFIFFAGHGQYDETFGEGFIVASNSLKNDPGKNSYISHNRLRNNINNIPCEHVFMIMDVCFGGTFDPVLAGTRGTVYDDIDNTEYIVKKLSLKTRKYLTSGSKEYVSDGVMGKHSPFTVKLLEALKTNGGEDQILTLSEVNQSMEKLPTTPRYGKFGNDEDGSDFLFIVK